MSGKVNSTKLVIFTFFLLTHSLQAAGYSENTDGQEVAETELMKTPTFRSLAQRFDANVGDTVRLPCLVDRLEGFVILWKKGLDIITVASQVLDKRVRLEEEDNGNYLVVAQVSPADTGQYSCQLSSYKPTQLTHSLSVRVPPVLLVEPGPRLVLKAGQTASLSCRAVSGSPQPSLAWRKVSKHGSTELSSLVLEDQPAALLQLERVTRHQAGKYVCSGDNGDTPVEKEVLVHVEFSPEISVEHHVVETRMEAEVELTCIVHAFPHAEVTWKKEDTVLGEEDPGLVMSSRLHHHSLTILSVSNSSLGRYYCLASNKAGQATKSVLVRGLAQGLQVTSQREGDRDTEYDLSWEVSSTSDILEWAVRVREEGAATWDIYSLTNTEPASKTGNLLLSGLSRAKVYQVQLSARNEFGWAESEKDFVFGTKGSDKIFKAAMTAGATGAGATSFISLISVTMTSAAVILMVFK